jgi:serine/threonine protein kinase
VFRGYDPERERLVAIKLFKLDLAPERVHQFVTELEHVIAVDCSHPGLVAPIATGIAEVSAFLATDYAAADSLDLWLRENGAAPPARAITIVSTLAAALDSVAGALLLHGAMHPRDVLLTDDEVRLTGIGVARALERIGVSPAVRRPYTAPERIAGVEWDRRTDVFSLAALAYELLWARRPAGTGESATEGIGEIKGGNATGLKRVFARALDDDPGNRFATATEFAEALKTAMPGVRVPSASAKRRPVRREIEPRLPLDIVASPRVEHDGFDLDVADRRAPDEARFVDLEIAPPLPQQHNGNGASPVEHADPRGHDRFEPPPTPDTPTAPPAGMITGGPDPLTVLDRSRSAVWPLALALMLGIVLGFAAGFGFRTLRPEPASAPASAASSEVPPGREFTEGTVAAPAKPAPPAPEPDARPKRDLAKPPAVPRPDLIGRLLIRSTPAGARAFVDDRDVGRTPAAVRDVAVGAHRVRITHDGYATEERSVTISRRRPTQSLTIALKRPAPAKKASAAPASQAPRTTAGIGGALVVMSRPDGAKVFLDGKLIGTTPMSLPSIAAGEHAIRLERDGYKPWTSTVRVAGPGQSRVTASLER